jgi:hypothetical protein
LQHAAAHFERGAYYIENGTDDTAGFYLRTASLLMYVLFSELWALFSTSRSGRRIKARGFFVFSIPLLAVAVIACVKYKKRIWFL